MKLVVLSLLCAIIASTFFIKRSTNNVCKTFEDYYTNRDHNKNCYYNPDHKLPVPKIIERHGYPVETHQVTTQDGYILSVFRIPHGKNSNKINEKPIFLQHGLALNSACFTSTGSKSLSFILADAGYDVWLGNFRGSKYSQNHTHLSYLDEEYWNFSFHEHGIYDIPAQIGYVNKITQKKITYIGYSMGSSSMYIYGTTFPDSAFKQVDMFINFAPAVFMDNIDSFASYLGKIWNYIEPIFKVMYNGRIFAKLFALELLLPYLCIPYPFQMKLCQFPDMLNFGFDYEQSDPETLPITMINWNDYTSPKTVRHFVQLYSSGEFRNYDYGNQDNLKIYGSSQPPTYDLSKLKIPVYLILAENDFIATKRNGERLYDALPNNIKTGIYYIKNKNFNHQDFVFAKDVIPLLYDHLLNFLSSRLNSS